MKRILCYLPVMLSFILLSEATQAQEALSPEQKKLLKAALKVAVAEEKILPDYDDLPSKKKIFLYNELVSLQHPELPPVFLKAGEKMKIGKVKVEVKTKAELLDSTRKEDVLFIRATQIDEPQGEFGIVSLMGQYALGTESRARGFVFKQASGQTYFFKKKDGKWKFDKVLVTFPNLLDYKEGFSNPINK